MLGSILVYEPNLYYIMETKICSKCKNEKTLNYFFKSCNTKDGYHHFCKSCMKKYSQKRKEKNKTYKFDYSALNINSKICTKCGIDKPLNEYPKDKNKSDGYKNACNDCTNKHRKVYRDKTPQQIEKSRIRAAEWYKIDINKTKRKLTNLNYVKNNKERIKFITKKYRKDRINTDPIFKLKLSISGTIYNSLKNKGFTKKSRTYEILGCSYEEFKQHLESKFESWMNWDNYGKYEKDKYNVGWDIDHIIPLKTAKTEEDVIRLNHYTNLQPLCSKINRDVKKHNLDYYS